MAGLNKFSLLASHQAGPFYNQNRQIDFTIPEGGVFDMSQCFIQLITRCITDTPQVHNMCLRNTGDIGITPKNIDLVRNCFLTGSKVGKLEDITRVNVLQTNLLELMKSTSEKMCMVDSIYQVRDFQEGMLLSPWVEWHKDGSSASLYRDNYLRIPLSQLFSLGSSVIDTSKTGDLTVHIELENLNYLEFAPVPLFHSPALKDEGKMQNVSTATSTITTLAWDSEAQTGIQYDSVEASPYFVGQKLNLTYSVGGTPTPAPIEVIVESITYNVVAKTISLQISVPFSQDPVALYENVLVSEVPAPETFATLSIATANLGVCEVVGSGKMMGSILEYMTWSVEQYSNGSNSLERIFEVEANAVNAFLMFNDNTSSLLSTQEKIDEYRMRIDNGDVYDRNIKVNYHDGAFEVLCHDPLHYDAINRTMLNSALPLKNLTCVNMRRDTLVHYVDLEARFNARDNAIMMLCTPLPLTTMSKKLQFSVSTKENGDRIENVILFKQIMRSVKLA